MCGALLFTSWGVLSLVLDRDVIGDPGMPPWLGLALCGASLAVCGPATFTGMRFRLRSGAAPWGQALAGGVSAWIAYAAVALAAAATAPRLPAGSTPLSYAWQRAADPFGWCVPLLVTSVVIAASALRAADERARGAHGPA